MTNDIKEKAREYSELPLTDDEIAVVASRIGDYNRIRALVELGFEAGAASRDKEIEVLKAQLIKAKVALNKYSDIACVYGSMPISEQFAARTCLKELAALEQK